MVFPKVNKQLSHWLNVCNSIEDPELRKQALLSITHKKFHCQGGSIYALYPGTHRKNMVRFIVALQTISDYLDNLCDRAGVEDETAFRQLHESMLDAVDPDRTVSDYYKLYPYRNDTQYLRGLVDECREVIGLFPSYHKVKEPIKKYIQLYIDLQSLKHLNRAVRDQRMLDWASQYTSAYPDLSPWEFSAAAGSTLGVFILLAAAIDPALANEEISNIESAYFPWICGLHILLDYTIDFEEDLQTGDLNFVSYYESQKKCEERLLFFYQEACKRCFKLPYPEFHRTVIRGLPAMYLSDPKSSSELIGSTSSNTIRACGAKTQVYYRLCKLLRMAGKL